MGLRTEKTRRPSVWRWMKSAFLVAMISACGQSSGCSGCDQEGEPFPDKDRVHSAIQVRLTEPGIAFLEDNLEPILSAALPEEGLSVCIPGQGGDLVIVQWGFCQNQCADGEVGCQLNIGIGDIDLQPIEPATLRASLEFDALNTSIDVFANPIVDCSISLNAPGFPVTIDLDLATPDPTRDLTFTLSNPQYRLADLNIRLQGGNGFLSPLCDLIDGAINFPIIGDLIFDLLQGFIDGFLLDLISGFVEDFTCRTCEDAGDCPIEGGGVACEGGRCMQGDTCIPAPLGVEGELSIGDLAGGFYAPGNKASFGYLLTPGSYVEVENGGLSLGVIGGATSERDRCVPLRAQPDPDVEPPRAPTLRGNLDPLGRPFEVGIGVSDTYLEHVMWAFFTGGALCIQVTGAQVEQLSTQFLGVALPQLRKLTRGNVPMAVTLSPQEVPVATIGANTVIPDPDAEGQFILEDPLLTLEIPELWLDFHAFMEGRWTRVFSLRADVVVPIGVAFSPDNGIIPVIGDLGGALQNLETANGEIMFDDPNRLVDLLPILIGPILNLALEGLADPIALPDIMGYQLDLQEHSITGIEDNTMLGIFANLSRAPEGMGLRGAAQTEIEVLEVFVPDTAEFEIDGEGTWRRPWAKVAFAAFDGSLDAPAFEYSWKVDNHSWSLFTPFEEVVIKSPAFLLQGRHTIQVRARRVDDYRTLDPTPAEVEVLIDSIAPTLAVSQDERGALVVDVEDMVSPVEAIEVVARVDEGPWGPLAALTLEPAHVQQVEVRAVDEAGNLASAVLETRGDALIGRPDPAAMAAEGCGCAVGEAPADHGAWWLLGLPFALLGLRRRRGGLGVLALFLALVGVIGCDDDTPSRDRGDAGPDRDAGPGCVEDDDCEGANFVCRNGMCVVQTCADDPSVCGAIDCGDRKAICNNVGVCECEPFCADGCGDGEYCCVARNACEPIPDGQCPADMMNCDDGYDLMIVQGGVVNPDSCEIEGAECDCVERMPLEVGPVGRFSDLAVVDGGAWVSAYAEEYGDLVVGRHDVASGMHWQFVDGVPDAPAEGGPSGPRGGVAEEGPDVGTHTSIAAGPDGTLHVAYYDEDARALKYARGAPDGDGHAWTVMTLDDEGDAGRYNSISVDARGVPGIAYRVGSVPEGDTFFSEARYRLAKNASPADPSDFNPAFVLHRRELPFEDPETGVYPEGTGLFTTQARDAAGMPAVAWYDRTAGALWMARFVDAGFGEPEMLAGWGHPDEDRAGDMGANVDLAFDAAGEPHLCFQDGLTDTLRYLAPGGDADEVIDDGARINEGGRGYAIHVVGDDCNMRFAPDGTPLVIYQDATGHDLWLARRGGEEGGWIRRTLRGGEAEYRGAYGFYTRARVSGGTLWISNYVYLNHEEPATERLEVFTEEL